MNELRAEVLVNRILLLNVLAMLYDVQWVKDIFIGLLVLVFITVVLEMTK